MKTEFIIYRDGLEIVLTPAEIADIKNQALHQDAVQKAEVKFREYIRYDYLQDNPALKQSFLEGYGFTPEEALDPDSEHFILDDLACRFKSDLDALSSEYNSIWKDKIKSELFERSVRHAWRKKADACSAVVDGVRKYYYKFWVDGKHHVIPYPVYVESDVFLSRADAFEKARTTCWFPVVEDADDVCYDDAEPINKEEYDARLDPDEYMEAHRDEWDDEDYYDEDDFDEDDFDENEE